MNDISVTLTQNEANALFTTIVHKIDDFNNLVKEAGTKGDVDRVIQLSKTINDMKSAQDKLFNSGARFWC